MTDQIELPKIASLHWNTEAGYEMASDYLKTKKGDLSGGQFSDYEVAKNLVFTTNHDFRLITWQTAAKERLRWLSVQVFVEIQRFKFKKTAFEIDNIIFQERSRLLLPNVSDFKLANDQFMIDRNDPVLNDIKLAACQRILWLTNKLS